MAEESSTYPTQSVPRFDGDYEHWSLIMETLLRSKEYWCVIDPGFEETAAGVAATEEQKALKLKDLKARNYLFQSTDKQILRTMTQKSTAKQIWAAMKMKYQGNTRVKKAQLQRLRREFEMLEMKEEESVSDYMNRVMTVANDMRNYGEDMTDVKIVEKVLRSLTELYNFVVCTIEESKDTDTLSVDELQSSLMVHEQKLKKKVNTNDQVMKVEHEESGAYRGRGRGRNSSNRSRGRGRGGRGRGDWDKSSVECYKCHQMGHFSYECPKGEKSVNYAEFDDTEDILLMTYANLESNEHKGTWFLDSACSNHMTGFKEWFIKLDENYRHTVRLGNDLRLTVKGIGDVRMEVEGNTQVVSRVYYIPELTSNLLSIGQLQEKDLTIIIKQGLCRIYHADRGLIVTSNMTRNRMFLVNAVAKPMVNECHKIDAEINTQIWHRRLGHVNHKFIRTMQYKHMVNGLPLVAEQSRICDVCKLGKQQREPIPRKSVWRASEKLQLIHTDLCGPISPASSSNKRYILMFIDDYSRKGWIHFLTNKSECFEIFKKFKVAVETETGLKIKGLRSDRGGEFTSNMFNEFCENQGIRRQLTTAFTPQQNGVAERRNKTVMNMVRCLLTEKNMPKWFWSEAARWANFILNRCITTALDDKVPEEAWSGIKPHVDSFRVFGCLAYAHIPSQLRTKLDDRSQRCVLLGISVESKAYRLYDPNSNKIIISKDVSFDEEKGWDWTKEQLGSNELTIPVEYVAVEDDSEPTTEVNPETVASQTQVVENTPPNSESQTSHQPDEEQPAVNTMPNIDVPESSNARSGVSKRATRTPAWFDDYQVGEGMFDEEVNLAFFSSCGDPIHYVEAAKDKKWVSAMQTEINAIEKNATWELVDAPADAKPIGVKWLYKTKFNEKGEIDKFKARLVVKGYAQEKGVDYEEVFAPVARWDTIRTMLAVAAQNKWVIYQLDVKSAFLHGELEETVYVNQPQGFIKKGEEHKVYKLKRALYGLKQAPRVWFKRIEGYFLKQGFKQSQYESTLFIKNSWNKVIMVSLYVDDLIYTGNDAQACQAFKEAMQKEFEMTDLGKMKYYLGVEVQQQNGSISICQKKYAKEVLDRFGLWEGNHVKNPIVQGTKVTREGDSPKVNDSEYKCMVGSLMYLTVTRPDLMYGVGLISRYMSDPREEHMALAKRILRYVKGTWNYGLKYTKQEPWKLMVYTDSDYAGDEEDRKCTSGYAFLLSGSAICWSSRKQETVTLSSTEAEYVACTNCACHCIWLKGIMAEICGREMGTLSIWCDNNSSIKMSKNPICNRKTKHIDVRKHYIRELVAKGVVKVEFCPSEEQVADVMTKPVKLETFEKMRNKLGVQIVEV
ncbi:hypothetical protein SSX86_005544 [Deinandra increscens subsp. villosa]|uniref:Polyprotein n=1 Tax=Deinandra increscens subsp. villosa TaxID=3103831 RepID=A0AAP0DQ95_9ASTR